MRILASLPLLFLASVSALAQTSPTTASDPQAVAVVQAAVTAIGGATAIGALQSWTFEAQASGRVANGTISEGLALSLPQNSTQPTGTAAKAPPPWAQPRSLFVPALISAVLVNESQDATFLIRQGTASTSVPNSTAVLFNRVTKTGRSITAQRWYFDNTSGLPNRMDFILPPRIGPIEGFAGTVILSNYKTVGGIQYPFQIVTFLQREHASETISLQSVTPSTTLPSANNAPSGGAQ